MSEKKIKITKDYKLYMQEKYLKEYLNLFRIIVFSLNGLVFSVHLQTFLNGMETPDGKSLPKISVSKLAKEFEKYGLVDILTFHKNKILKVKRPVYRYLSDNQKNKQVKINLKTTNATHFAYLKSGLLGEILCRNWVNYSNYKESFATTNMSFNFPIRSYTFLNNIKKTIEKYKLSKDDLPYLNKQIEILQKRYKFQREIGFKMIDSKKVNTPKGFKLDLGLSSSELVGYEDFCTLSFKNIYIQDVIWDEKEGILYPVFAILNFTDQYTPAKIASLMIKLWRFCNIAFKDIEGRFVPLIKFYSLTNITEKSKEKVYKCIEDDEEFESCANHIRLNKKILYLKINIKHIFEFVDFNASKKLLSNKIISSIL